MDFYKNIYYYVNVYIKYMYNFNHLYYFYETARMGSVTGAAKSIGIQQPSLTIQLRRLENELKIPLFRKVGRGIALTAMGESVFSICRRIFEPAHELKLVTETQDHAKPTSLRLGVSSDVERPFMVDLLGDASRSLMEQGQPYMLLKSDTHDVLIQLMKEGVLDAVVSTRADYSPNVDLLGKREMEVGVVTSGNQKKVGDEELLLKQAIWALPTEGSRLREEVNSYFERKKITPIIGFESDVLASVIRAVVDGFGYSVLPLQYIQTEMKRGTIRVIGKKGSTWKHCLWLMSLRPKRSSFAVAALNQVFLRA